MEHIAEAIPCNFGVTCIELATVFRLSNECGAEGRCKQRYADSSSKCFLTFSCCQERFVLEAVRGEWRIRLYPAPKHGWVHVDVLNPENSESGFGGYQRTVQTVFIEKLP